MHSTTYKAIASQLNFQPRLRANLLILLWDMALLYAAHRLIDAGRWHFSALAVAILAIVAMNGFGLMHEGAHRTLSRNRWLNFLLAHIGGALSWLPPIPYQQGHLEHHRWAGNRKHDPVINRLYDICERPGFLRSFLKVCWGLWVPVIAFGQLLVLWTYPVSQFVIRPASRDRKKAIQGLFSEAVTVCLWVAILKLGAFDLMHLGCALYFYLLLTETLSFPHHHGMATLSHDHRWGAQDQHQVTRSCYFPKGVSELLCLNFNFHVEHHLFPTLPWWRLREARTRIREALKEEYTECIGFGWDRENRKKDGPSAILGANLSPPSTKSSAA